MENKIAQTIIAGMIATVIMTVVGLIAPRMGLPRMNPAGMLSGMMELPLVMGYVVHVMIGVIFAAVYVYLFSPKVRIGNKLLKGLVFGFAVFAFAQIMMFVIGLMKAMPSMEDKMLIMIGSLIGHLVYGIVIALMVPNYEVKKPNRESESLRRKLIV